MSVDAKARPSIFEYESFDQFLKDIIRYLKVEKRIPKSTVSRRAQFKSPSYLKMVMDGQRNISFKMAKHLADGLQLHPEEKEYFLVLLKLKYAQTELEKISYLSLLRRYKTRFSWGVVESGLSGEKLESLKIKIRNFISDLKTDLGDSLDSESIYQLNMQLLALVRLPREEGGFESKSLTNHEQSDH